MKGRGGGRSAIPLRFLEFLTLVFIGDTTEKEIDGAYARMFRTALNFSWKDHITNEDCLSRLTRDGFCGWCEYVLK